MDCAAVREELGAYVLDALDPAETRAIEQHVWTCDACRGELAALEEAAGAIAMTAPLRRAPERLRSRVLAATAGRESMPRGNGATPAPAPIASNRRWRWAAFAAAAAAGVLLAATLGWAVALQVQLNEVQDEQERIVAQHEGAQLQFASTTGDLQAHEAALYLLSDQSTRYAALQGQGAAADAAALYAWSPGERLGVLLSKDLDQPPDGMTYHLWLQMENGSIDGGTFAPDADGTAEVIVEGSDATPAPGQSRGPLRAVVVTMEQEAGGEEQPEVVMSGPAAQ
jgi:hypothetical protein